MKDADGFTLIEVVVTLLLISIGFLAVSSASSSSTRTLLQSKQRQAASEEATAHIEHIRNVPYAHVALQSQPVASSDAGHPDYYVSNNGLDYDHTLGSGGDEPLLVDTTNGLILHSETTTVGSTALTIFQYVTWVDDPNITGTQDYKRVVVAAMFVTGTSPGRPHTVYASTLLTAGSVTVGGTQSQAQPGSTPSPSPTPSPTPSGPCPDDTEGPTGSISLLSGSSSQTGFTASTSVSISSSPVDPCTPITVSFSNDNSTFGGGSTYDASNPTTTWTLPSGDGSKSVWATFTDGVGNVSTVGPQSITLDQTFPAVPGTATRTVSCQGNDRTTTLNWGVSTDTNLVGYRVYKNSNNGGWVPLLTTASLTTQDTDVKTLNSLSYKIVGYDKAGNEGPATEVISLSKNQCS